MSGVWWETGIPFPPGRYKGPSTNFGTPSRKSWGGGMGVASDVRPSGPPCVCPHFVCDVGKHSTHTSLLVKWCRCALCRVSPRKMKKHHGNWRFGFSAVPVVWGFRRHNPPSGKNLIWKLLYIYLLVTYRTNLYPLFALVHVIFSDIVKYESKNS